MIVIPSQDWLLTTRLERCDKTILRRCKRKVYHESNSLCDKAEMAATSCRSKGRASEWRAVPRHEDTACITCRANNQDNISYNIYIRPYLDRIERISEPEHNYW